MTALELIAVSLVVLMFTASYLELFHLRRENRDSRDRLLVVQGELFNLKRRLEEGIELTGAIEPGLYVQKQDPVTGAKSMQKAEDASGPWADLLNERPIHDVFNEMMEAQSRRG